MRTWISHLRIAANLLQHFPDLDEVTFAFGNLSPDSGVPNADWSQFDPPKEVTHSLKKGEEEHAIHDLVYYGQYLAPIQPEKETIGSRWETNDHSPARRTGGAATSCLPLRMSL